MRVVWWHIVPVWTCFLLRGAFYSAMLPLWEGYDEWAHFSVVRAVAGGKLLPDRGRPVPRDVEESLRLAPVPWEMRSYPAPMVTHDAWWTLPDAERRSREAALRAMPRDWQHQHGSGSLIAYEALQPPLYYWLAAPFLGAGSLATQALVLRWLSVALASLTIPFVFLIGMEVFADRALALGCAAVAALMPGFLLDIARAGNDALAVPLFTALTWAVLRAHKSIPLLLSLGLLTKVYFLTAVPVALTRLRRKWWIGGAAALVIAGWWYLRNLLTTGTLSGLSESVMLRGTGFLGMLARIPAVPWRTAVDAILFSHLYFGGWSSLTVRSWMYHVFYAIAFVAAAGLVMELRRPPVRWLLAIYGMFWLGQLYNVLLLYLSKGLPGSMGWYMYAVIGAEVVLCVAGFGRFGRWAAAAGAVLFAVFDLYTVHAVAIPYYTGMIRHKPNGALEALHLDRFRALGFSGAFERLSVVSPHLLIVLWSLYLAATAGLVFCALRNAAGRRDFDAGGEHKSGSGRAARPRQRPA
jgi:hypothetical protein